MFYFALNRYDQWKTSDAEPKKQPLMTQFTTSEKKYAAMHPRQKELQKAVITHLIVRGNLPLNTVERPWFKIFMAVVDLKFNVPCRRKVASEIKFLYDVKRNVLLNKLMSVQSLPLTLDMWSDRRMRPFMGVTVHLLTSDMKLESYLLDMGAFAGSHTGEQIGAHYVSLVEEYKIREKVRFIVTDNAANMIYAFKTMDDLFADPEAGDVDDVSGDEAQDGEVEDDSTDAERRTDGVFDQVDEVISFEGEEPLSDDTLDQVMGNLGSIGKKRLPTIGCSRRTESGKVLVSSHVENMQIGHPYPFKRFFFRCVLHRI